VKRVRFVAAARREFLAQVAYYRKEDSALGARFSTAVEDATVQALVYPLAGSPASRSTRRVFVRDFPFSVVYRPSAHGITVFAVAHDSRRPGYWSSRVQESGSRYAASDAAA
jgi:plasmid stabilization system protein ParE